MSNTFGQGISCSFFLGSALVDPQAREITLDGQTARLEPRVFAVLMKFVEADGRTLCRADLLECWPEGAGSDEALTQTVSALRRALGDHTRPYRLIQTLPKSGYRLVSSRTEPAPVQQQKGLSRPRGERAASVIEKVLARPATAFVVALGLAMIAVSSAAAIDAITRRPPAVELILQLPLEPPPDQ